MTEKAKIMKEQFTERELILIREALDSLAAYYSNQSNVKGQDISKDYKNGCNIKAQEVRDIYKIFN